VTKIGKSVLSGVPNIKKAESIIQDYHLDEDEIAFIRQADLRKTHIVDISNAIKFPSKIKDDKEKDYNRKSAVVYGNKTVRRLIDKDILRFHRWRELKDQDGNTYSPLQWTNQGQKVRALLRPTPSTKLIITNQGKKVEKYRKQSTVRMYTEQGKKVAYVKEYEKAEQDYNQTKIENIAGVFRLSTWNHEYDFYTPSENNYRGNKHEIKIDLGDKYYNQSLYEYVITYGLDYGKDDWSDYIVVSDKQLYKTIKLIKKERDLVVKMLDSGIGLADYDPKTLEQMIMAWSKLA